MSGPAPAVRCVEKGYETYGLELDSKRVASINKGISQLEDEYLKDNLKKFHPQATTNEKIIKKADIVLICVPTPVDEKFYPILDPVINASKTIAKNMKKGALVILESTVNPGVSEEIVMPIFEEQGWKVGRDVAVAHCPERINPGKDAISKGYDVRNIPQVVGASDKNGLARAKEFYESILTR